MKLILVPVDFSDVTDLVLEKACEFAGAFLCPVELVHVIPDEADAHSTGLGNPHELYSVEKTEGHSELMHLAKQIEGRGIRVSVRVLHGIPEEAIVAERRRVSAGMIIIGSHGHSGLRRLLLGSVSEGVIREALCPVVIVPNRCLNDA